MVTSSVHLVNNVYMDKWSRLDIGFPNSFRFLLNTKWNNNDKN